MKIKREAEHFAGRKIHEIFTRVGYSSGHQVGDVEIALYRLQDMHKWDAAMVPKLCRCAPSTISAL